MALYILGLILFFGVHLVRVVAPGFRTSFIAARGEVAWKGLYAVASLISLVVLVYGYGQARPESIDLYYPPVWASHITLSLMLIALVFLVASQLPAGRIVLVVKHPMLISVKIWALAHLLANGDLVSVLLFASFLAWAVVVQISFARRQRRGEWQQRAFVSSRYDVLTLLIAVLLYLAILFRLHEWLIGVAPAPFAVM